MSRPPAQSRPATVLLRCGVAAGPVFLGTLLAQALWRPGFELGTHAVSLLARGEAGWTQITAFVLTGALAAAGGAGIRRATADPAGRFAGALVTVLGAGLVGTGVFVVDPGHGFPPGGPPPATTWSWHGLLHDVGTAVALNAGIAAAAVLAWRTGRRRRVGAVVHAAAAVAMAALAWSTGPGVPLRQVLSAVVLTLWLSGTCLALLHTSPHPTWTPPRSVG